MKSFCKRSKNNKAFTLIELLTVIIVIGIFLLVVIPSVSTYVADARKDTYLNSARGYIKEVKTMITSRELTSMKRANTTYYIPTYCIHKESGGESPYGEWESAYVVVTYADGEFEFFWTSNDETNTGILLTREDLLTRDRIITDVTGISTSISVGDREKILVLNENCTVESATEKSPLISQDRDVPVEEDDMTGVDIEDDALRPMYSVSPTGWAQKKTVTITYPGSSDKKEYSLDGGITWQNYTGPVAFTANGNIIAKNTVGGNYINGSSQAVTQIDTTAPISATFSYTVTSKSIKVVANGVDPESGILYYQFSNDGGTTWTSVQNGNTYSFTNLKSGTYPIKIRAINGTYVNHKYNGSTLESETIDVQTTKINVPLFSVEPDTTDWVQKKTVTINYDSGYTQEYSIDGGRVWIKYENPIEMTTPGTILARINDGINYVSSSSLSITKVDSTAPTSATFTTAETSKSITVTASGVDGQSGITHYQFSKDGGSNWSDPQTSNVYTYNNLATGSYNIKVRVINGTYKRHGISNNYLDSETESTATAAIAKPTYKVTPESGWANKKTVTITYPSGYTNQYSTDNGSTWKTYTAPIEFTSNGSIIARSTDGVNIVTADKLTIDKLDTTAPTCKLKVTSGSSNGTYYYTNVTIGFETANDTGGSEVHSYGIGDYSTKTKTKNTDGTETYTGYIKDNAGNTNTCSISITRTTGYTLTYNSNGGSTCSPTTKSITYGNQYGTLCAPTKAGSSFAGWYTSASGGTQVTASTTVSVTGNQTLYAHWNTCPAGQYSDGGSISCSNCPSGYTSNAGATAQSSCYKTLTATMNANGGSYSSGNPTCALYSGSSTCTVTFKSTSPTRTGYTFKGWSTSSSATSGTAAGGTANISANTTFYATWKVNCPSGYTFQSNGSCVKTYTATTSYSCPSGGTLSGTTCTKSSSYNASSSYSGGCDWERDSGHMSPSKSNSDAIKKAELPSCNASSEGDEYKVHDCGEGKQGCKTGTSNYNCRSSVTCTKENYRYTWKVYTCECSGTLTYSCPSGGTLSGTKCYTSSSYTATANYSCNSGDTRSGTTCTSVVWP